MLGTKLNLAFPTTHELMDSQRWQFRTLRTCWDHVSWILEKVIDIGEICLAKILSNYDMTHFFENPKFMSKIDMRSIELSYDLEVKMHIGDQSLISNWVERDYEIRVGKCRLLTNLLSMTTKRYDIILGVNFENEILLRREGCEDPKILLFLS